MTDTDETERYEIVCALGHPEPTKAADGYVCRRHWHWLLSTLTQIEELWALLPDALIPGPGGDGRSATRVGSPAPGSVDVMALSDPRGERDWVDDPDAIPDVLGALYSWVRIIAEEHDDGTERGELRMREIANCGGTGVIHRLREWRNYIVRQAWVDDYAADLAALHRHVARASRGGMWPQSIGRCPNDQAPMYVTIGIDSVTCRRCNATWEGVHLARLKLIHEQEQERRTQERRDRAAKESA